jgi:GNAT superfamily N-acetyltransferase
VPSDDAASAALLDAFDLLARWLPSGRVLRRGDLLAAVTGVPIPGLNGVWAPSGGAADLAGALDEVVATGLPHCLEFPAGDPRGSAVAEERGMQRVDDVPLMRLDAEPSLPAEGPFRSMRIRRLAPQEAALHAEVAAAGFGAPVELFEPLATPELLAHDELAVYVGEIDGAPVTTGVGLRAGDGVGVFNVATPPEHRRRGYGAALTAHIVKEARADGAGWSWLQSSPEGLRVYESLGYRTVATWELWVRA